MDTLRQWIFAVIYFWRRGENIPHGVAMVFDLTSVSSFCDVKQWAQELDRYCCEGVQRVLIGNKADLQQQRKVDAQQAWELAKNLGVAYFETSAKDGQGVDEAFLQLSHNIREQLTPKKEVETIDLSKQRPAWETKKSKKSKTCNIQ